MGVIIGILCPLALFGVMILVRFAIHHVSLDKAAFVCVALNILPIRYFLVSADHENTGKGILFITVLMIIAVTILNFSVIQKLLSR